MKSIDVARFGGQGDILQSADKQGNPSCHIHAPGSKRTIPMHACSINGPTSTLIPAASFHQILHLTCSLSLEAKSECKKKKKKDKIFHSAKNVNNSKKQDILYFQPKAFSLTSDIIIQNTLEIKRTLFNKTKQDKTCKLSR